MPSDKPSKTDLQRALKQIEHTRLDENKEFQRLEDLHQKHQDAMEEFKRTNSEFKRLERNLERARVRKWDFQSKTRDEKRHDLRRVWIMLRTEGVTDRVIREVRRVARKYLGTNI